MRMMRGFLGLAVVCGLLACVVGPARADQWDFRMLDGGSPVPATVTVDLGTWVFGSLPAAGTMDINVLGLVRNLSPQMDLLIGGYSEGYSGAPPARDGLAWWTSNLDSYVGAVIAPGDELTMAMGTFDGAAFLSSLPANGTAYSALLDIQLVGITWDMEPFDPLYPDGVMPGPPSLRVIGRVIGEPGEIPEAGTLALFGGMGLWSAPWMLRRMRSRS